MLKSRLCISPGSGEIIKALRTVTNGRVDSAREIRL